MEGEKNYSPAKIQVYEIKTNKKYHKTNKENIFFHICESFYSHKKPTHYVR